MENNIKRQIAYKVKINDIIKGEYVKEEGWKPNYIKTRFGNVSRVNILAVVVGKNDDGSFIIDDGSGKINARSFDTKVDGFEIGDVVLVIGKPRSWNSQKYVIYEVVKKINDKKWIKVRKFELDKLKKCEVKEGKIVEAKEKIAENPYEKILNLIKETDLGEGASYEKVLVKSGIKEAEETLRSLLEQGEIFEIRP
jgi:RPA family protein